MLWLSPSSSFAPVTVAYRRIPQMSSTPSICSWQTRSRLGASTLLGAGALYHGFAGCGSDHGGLCGGEADAMAPARRPQGIEPSQEEWEVRVRRRQSAIQCAMSEPEYQLRAELAHQHGDDLPQPPDSTTHMTTRMWNLSFEKWRKDLQNWNPAGPPGLRWGAGVRETGNAEQALAASAAEQRQAAEAPAGTAKPAAEQPLPTRAPPGLQQEHQQQQACQSMHAENARQRRRLIALKHMPADRLQEHNMLMCWIYPMLVNKFVAHLPHGYGGPQCLVSHNDLRKIFDKACDMAMAYVVGDAGEEHDSAHVSSASAAAEHTKYQ